MVRSCSVRKRFSYGFETGTGFPETKRSQEVPGPEPTQTDRPIKVDESEMIQCSKKRRMPRNGILAYFARQV